jgi:hypothetical protein
MTHGPGRKYAAPADRNVDWHRQTRGVGVSLAVAYTSFGQILDAGGSPGGQPDLGFGDAGRLLCLRGVNPNLPPPTLSGKSRKRPANCVFSLMIGADTGDPPHYLHDALGSVAALSLNPDMAWSRSAMRSSTFSMPTDTRTRPSLMFARRRASAPMLACVMLAGC